MNGVVTIPKKLNPSEQGFGWWLWRVYRVFVECPNGHRALLDHAIGEDGTVTPSIDCSKCSWHVLGRLEGWKKP